MFLSGLESAHHPFTAPHPADTDLVYTDPPAVSDALTLAILQTLNAIHVYIYYDCHLTKGKGKRRFV